MTAEFTKRELAIIEAAKNFEGGGIREFQIASNVLFVLFGLSILVASFSKFWDWIVCDRSAFPVDSILSTLVGGSLFYCIHWNRTYLRLLNKILSRGNGGPS